MLADAELLRLLQHGRAQGDVGKGEAAVPEQDGLFVPLAARLAAGDDLAQLGVQGRFAEPPAGLGGARTNDDLKFSLPTAVGFNLLQVPAHLQPSCISLVLTQVCDDRSVVAKSSPHHFKSFFCRIED